MAKLGEGDCGGEMKEVSAPHWLNFRGLSYRIPLAECVHVLDKLQRKSLAVRPFHLYPTGPERLTDSWAFSPHFLNMESTMTSSVWVSGCCSSPVCIEREGKAMREEEERGGGRERGGRERKEKG